MFFIPMYSVLNKFSEYIYLYESKNITSYAFLLVFKIVESLQCILNSQENTCVEGQVFSFDFCNIFNNTFFVKHLRKTAYG